MRIHRPVHDDPFNFMIETVDKDGNKIAAIAGAENIFAARAAFDYLIGYNKELTFIRIRHGARILTTQQGKQEV